MHRPENAYRPTIFNSNSCKRLIVNSLLSIDATIEVSIIIISPSLSLSLSLSLRQSLFLSLSTTNSLSLSPLSLFLYFFLFLSLHLSLSRSLFLSLSLIFRLSLSLSLTHTLLLSLSFSLSLTLFFSFQEEPITPGSAFTLLIHALTFQFDLITIRKSHLGFLTLNSQLHIYSPRPFFPCHRLYCFFPFPFLSFNYLSGSFVPCSRHLSLIPFPEYPITPHTPTLFAFTDVRFHYTVSDTQSDQGIETTGLTPPR
ncbi:unnamed protein product [Acanthosepion pharaonis]|uniref:Uncharacterized protein n=1 Tax=Acanthosepion pharaonis TaxID=158019 RepID=A0A812AJ84_ACAPH|nr:unnamed protein product [Sepia pharaonis]